jgi:excinuclease ABC subunit C
LCKPCFNRQIGLCPGVCSGDITKEEYAEQIQNIVLFFEGKKKELLKGLEKKMKELAKMKDFEGAVKTFNHKLNQVLQARGSTCVAQRSTDKKSKGEQNS